MRLPPSSSAWKMWKSIEYEQPMHILQETHHLYERFSTLKNYRRTSKSASVVHYALFVHICTHERESESESESERERDGYI